MPRDEQGRAGQDGIWSRRAGRWEKGPGLAEQNNLRTQYNTWVVWLKEHALLIYHFDTRYDSEVQMYTFQSEKNKQMMYVFLYL